MARVSPPDPFDPYHKWLGIPPKDQPPTHYRLLSIETFEPDPDVIEHAADRQMAHIRQFQIGGHVDHSQRILNEIATAKRCLLTAADKARYDEQIRSRHPAAVQTPQAVQVRPVLLPVAQGIAPMNPPSAFPLSVPDQAPQKSTFPSVVNRDPTDLRRYLSYLAIPLAAIVVIVAIWALLPFLTDNGNGKRTDEPSADSPSTGNVRIASPRAGGVETDLIDEKHVPSVQVGSARPKSAPTSSSNDEPQTDDANPRIPDGSAETDTPFAPFAGAWRVTYSNGVIRQYAIADDGRVSWGDEQGRITQRDQDYLLRFDDGKLERLRREDDQLIIEHYSPAETYPGGPTLQAIGSLARADDVAPVPAESDDAGVPDPSGAQSAPDSEHDSPPSDTRLPVPAKPDHSLAEKTIRVLFADELSQAKEPAQKARLSEKLREGAEEARDDITGRYVLLVMARDAAEEGDDFDLVTAAIDELAAAYQVDGISEKVAALDRISKGLKAPAECALLADEAMTIARMAAQSDRHDMAAKSISMASRASKRARSADLVTEVQSLSKELVESRKTFERYSQAQQKLKDSPDDRDANEQVGRYRCFSQQQWAAGLPFLAKSRDATLQFLAQRDLQEPTESVEQAALGDAWWEFAESDQAAQDAARQRAATWYRKSQDQITGLDKVRVQKRLEQIAADPSRVAALWVLARGGSIGVVTNGTYKEVKDEKNLPATPFRVTFLFLGDRGITNAGELSCFQGLEDLEYIDLRAAQIKDAGLKMLSNHKDVEYLWLISNGITDDGLATIGRMRRMRELGIEGNPVTDAGLAKLSGLRRLEVLFVNGTNVTDTGMEHLRGMARMKRLFVNRTLTDRGLSVVQAMPELNRLELIESQVTDAGLANLKQLKKLRVLDLRGSKMTDGAIPTLSSLESLTELYLGGTAITDAGVAELQQALPNCKIDRKPL